MARFHFVHVGVAFGLMTAAVTGFQLVAATGPAGSASAYVPIAPCRLVDTRAAYQVGTRSTPISAQEIATFAVWGQNGNCDIPTTATGIASNVTAVNPTQSSYLTVFPADAAQPLASNLNWTPTSPPTPNQVTVGLSATGAIKVYNLAGTIDVIVDVVGYYVLSSSGPAGPTGATGPIGPAGPPNRISNAQIALLQWGQDPGRAATFNAGPNPFAIAFDGTYIWVTNNGGSTVSRFNPVTGIRDNFPVGGNPQGLAYDGTSIWVANNGSNFISKVNPTTGDKVDYPTACCSLDVAYDGSSLWVTEVGGGNTVSKINPATGSRVDYPTGNTPIGVAYDGTNIWVTNYLDNTVSKINPATGAVIISYPTGVKPRGLAFDGTNIWIANNFAGTVSKMNPATGAKVDITVGSGPTAVAYDGRNIWVASTGGTVTKINSGTGAVIDTYSTGSNPNWVAFDGTNVWVANAASNTISKIVP